MVRMTPKEQLENIRLFEQELVALEEYRQQVYGRLLSIQSSLPTEELVIGGEKLTQADRINDYIDKTRELDKLVAQLDKMKMDAIGLIYQLPDGVKRTILIERYINHLPWDEVQERIGYEKTNTFDLHREAIRELGKVRLDSE